VKVDDAISGPFTGKALCDLAERGSLRPCHFISKDRMKWARAGVVKGLVFGEEKPYQPTRFERSAVEMDDAGGESSRSPSTHIVHSALSFSSGT
jgi:hypothetical protein